MPIFIKITDPLRPLKDFAPVERPQGVTISQYVAEAGIDMEGMLAVVDNQRFGQERWGETLPVNARVIFTPEIGYSTVIALIIGIVIAVALYFFLPMPSTDQGATEGPSVYTLAGKKNSARLGEPIERHYGRVRHWPSYMARPFNMFKGNEQYLHALFCVGLGKYTIHNVKVENTELENFDEVEYVIYQPGEKVKLFPLNVQTSSEVAGIELYGPNEDDFDDWAGGFVVCVPGALAYKIQVDIAFRQGLFRVATSDLGHAGVTAEFESRLIDDDGNPLGDWEPLFSVSEYMSETEPQRFTLEAEVTEGRYEVRGIRTNDKAESYKYQDALHWEGLRAFCDIEQDFGDVTLLAVIARASNNLNDSTKSAFNVEITGKVPVYDLEAEEWTLTESRSPVWAFCDVLRAKYGKHLSKRFIDLPAMVSLAEDFETDGIRFDGSFTEKITVWEALQTIMNVGNAVPVVTGGIISVVRDIPRTVPTLGFNNRNIVKDSMTVQTSLVNHSGNDGIEVEYVDDTDSRRKTVKCLLGTDRGINLKQVRLIGCRSRNMAYRWGLYRRAVELYQKENFIFETGIEGGTAIFGDLIAIQHETLPSESDFLEVQSGRLATDALTFEDDLTVIELPFAPVFEPGETYRIGIRDNTGTVRGPYACEAHSTDSHKLTLAVALDHSMFEVEDDGETALFWFGLTGQEFRLAKIVKVEPGGESDKVKITAVPYDERIYSFGALEAPALLEEYAPPEIPALPEVEGLTVSAFPDSPGEYLISWKPSFGATSYLVKTSTTGADFRKIATVTNSNCIIQMEPGDLWVRVRAINEGAGPSASWNGTVGPPQHKPGVPANLRLREAVVDRISVEWDAEPLTSTYTVRVYVAGPVLISEKATTKPEYNFSKAHLVKRQEKLGLTFARSYEVTVEAENVLGSRGECDPETFAKEAPNAPTSLAAGSPTGADYPVTWACTNADDETEFNLYASTVNGFTPGPGNLVDTVSLAAGVLNAPVTPLYWRVAAFDDWGGEQMSAQATIP